MTSNGAHGAHGERVLPECAAAGLEPVNFSLFGTTPAELAEAQHSRYANPKLADRKITALQRSIATCEEHGVKASANIVVLDYSHAPRVHRLLDDYSPHLSVRLLTSLDHGPASIKAIERTLAERGAVAEAHYITAGVSGSRTAYRTGGACSSNRSAACVCPRPAPGAGSTMTPTARKVFTACGSITTAPGAITSASASSAWTCVCLSTSF